MITQPNLTMLARVSRAVIHRINYPKREAGKMSRRACLSAKIRPLLSHWDEEEVAQTCALALHASGALYRDTMQLADWKNCFRASRAILRIDRGAHEDATDVAKLDQLSLTIAEPARFTARRSAIARKIRYNRACISLAYAADKSRQRTHNRDKARRFLRFLASQAGASGLGQAAITAADDLSGLRHASATFRRYVTTGEDCLTAEAHRGLTRHAPRPIKSFSDARLAMAA